MIACKCFCLPRPEMTTCLRTYPYLQFQESNVPPRYSIGPVPGSVVCSAWPCYAPVSWHTPTATLYVQTSGPLVCDVWKSNPVVSARGTYTDTMTISSLSPGGIVLVREYSTHVDPAFPRTIYFTNNYPISSGLDFSSVTNPYRLMSSFSFDLVPFGSGIEPDLAKIDEYMPWLDEVPCTLRVVADPGTTRIMGTTYTLADLSVTCTVQITGPHKRWQYGGGAFPGVPISDGPGTLIGSISAEFSASGLVSSVTLGSGGGDFGGAYSVAGVYRGTNTSNPITYTCPEDSEYPNSLNVGANTIYVSLGADAQFFMDRSLGTTALRLAGNAYAMNGGSTSGAEQSLSIVQSKGHDASWGPATLGLPNVDASDRIVIRRSIAPDPTKPVNYKHAEFKIRVTAASASLTGVH